MIKEVRDNTLANVMYDISCTECGKEFKDYRGVTLHSSTQSCIDEGWIIHSQSVHICSECKEKQPIRDKYSLKRATIVPVEIIDSNWVLAEVESAEIIMQFIYKGDKDTIVEAIEKECLIQLHTKRKLLIAFEDFEIKPIKDTDVTNEEMVDKIDKKYGIINKEEDE